VLLADAEVCRAELPDRGGRPSVPLVGAQLNPLGAVAEDHREQQPLDLRVDARPPHARVEQRSADLEMFADLFTDVGRRSVPPMIVAVVMVLQRIDGCSDREAVDRFAFDARWKYAAGGLAFDYPGFVHTVLVDMRARLAASGRPDRIFEVTLAAAKAAGLVGRKRVLDSTPLYDAVATMDTVTLIRSGIRGVLKAAGADLEAELRR